MNSEGEKQILFEFSEGNSDELLNDDNSPTVWQEVVFERSLSLGVYRREAPSIYRLAANIGGLIVVLWLVGYVVSSCLTVNAYEDHVVQAMYPTKEILKQRLRVYTAQFPISEQEEFKDILEGGLELEEEDMKEPDLDVSRYGCFRCFCRCLSFGGCFCNCCKRCCRAIWCCKVCKQSRTERMFEAGREFYKNDISIQRLVQAMQAVEAEGLTENQNGDLFKVSPNKRSSAARAGSLAQSKMPTLLEMTDRFD